MPEENIVDDMADAPMDESTQIGSEANPLPEGAQPVSEGGTPVEEAAATADAAPVEEAAEPTQEVPETELDKEAEEDAAQAAAATVTAPEGVVSPDQAPEGSHLAVINAAGEFKYVMEREAALERARGGGHFLRVPTEEEQKAFDEA